ncbi:unnamed protein product [Symbiodinium necroappetens]|uniref:Uncharacterized protein n=1 Tax=Symbiodinium necroappetens TaxID=1628268 RepID=A0A812Y0I2_9DINO|nr:unnamed protein product [Symbiodinium necroappetens]
MQDIPFLSQLGFPSNAAGAVEVIWETSPEDTAQENETAYMASLIDYHKAPVSGQLGLDKAMETEWQKYVEFNAVVPCTKKEMTELTRAGHVCIPTKWVLTDKNEHLSGTPGYTPKWKARLVACGNFEQMNGEDIRADSPSAEQEGIVLICSWADPHFEGHPKGVPDAEIQQVPQILSALYSLADENGHHTGDPCPEDSSEAYSMQHATEHGDRLRASVLDLQGKLPTRGGWEESTRDELSQQAPAPHGDILRRIPTGDSAVGRLGDRSRYRAMPQHAQRSETVLGKQQDMLDPQDIDPENIDPEVSVTLDDNIPSEFQDSSEEDAEHDRIAQLMQRYIAFINEMQATRPDILRGFLGARQAWCLLFGFVAFCMTLLIWHPQTSPAEYGCIFEAVEVHAGFVGSYVGDQTVTWWCIFEIAAFLHSRSPGCKPDLQIVPPLLGPALLGCEVLFGISLFVYSYVESSLSASEDGILVGELYVVVTSASVLLFVSFMTHALRGHGRNIDTLQRQLRGFKVEHARSACCDLGHRSSSERLTCDRKVIQQCIAAWYSSLDSFELQVQTDVRLAIIDQLAYKAISYQRTVLLNTPYVWIRLDYAASHADDPIRQVIDMAQTFTYLLAILPLVDKVGIRLCYRWRARCCRLHLDFLLSLAVVIVGLSCYIACYAIQLYVFRQNDRGLLLSVISMLSWWTVAAILWRFI